MGVSNWLAMEYILVSHFDGDNFFKFSELLNWNVHDLHLPVRVLASIYTNSRSPLLLADRNNNEGVHFVKNSRLSVMGKMSRLQMNLNEALTWDSESASYAYLRCCNNYLRLLDHWRCYNDMRWLYDWLLHNHLWL